ncbi:MAG: hypothetical protein IAE88_17830 [Rhodobacteraceae bacterium]|nr:hypothetical protein [Paracoccaceae bacterium]MCB0058422.1 hypothetical protein [Caldilineaceae bacterium]
MQTLRGPQRLTPAERARYTDRRDKALRRNLRLEQERMGFGWAGSALAALQQSGERPSRQGTVDMRQRIAGSPGAFLAIVEVNKAALPRAEIKAASRVIAGIRVSLYTEVCACRVWFGTGALEALP